MPAKFTKFINNKPEFKITHSLTSLLHDHLTDFDTHRGVERLHASELTKPDGFCPRFFILAHYNPKVLRDRWLSTPEAVTFQIGRDLQDAVVHWFADMKRAFGDWKCLGCDVLYEAGQRPEVCEDCGSKHFKPVEMRFKSKTTGASCGIDMLGVLDDPQLWVTEIKTMDKDMFKDLKAPLAEHKERTNLYMRLVEDSDHPLKHLIKLDKARILYVSKGYGTLQKEKLKAHNISGSFSPFKEFIVDRDDSQTDYLMDRAKLVEDWKTGKIGIPNGLCSTSFDKRAASCTACKDCFSGKYPPTYEWEP